MLGVIGLSAPDIYIRGKYARLKRILVIDDEEDILEIVKYLLRSNGYHVKTLASGTDVPEVVKRYHPDLILLDVIMPGKPGTEICKELKTTITAPIIFFTAFSGYSDNFFEWHADGLIEKPFDLNDLLRTIEAFLGKTLAAIA